MDAQAGDAEVAGLRMAAEAFLAVEVMFRGEAAVSLEVTGVFPAVAAVSLAVAVFLAVAEVVCPGPAAVLLAVVAPAFRRAAVIFPAEAAVPPDIASRKILHCSPICAARGRVRSSAIELSAKSIRRRSSIDGRKRDAVAVRESTWSRHGKSALAACRFQ